MPEAGRIFSERRGAKGSASSDFDDGSNVCMEVCGLGHEMQLMGPKSSSVLLAGKLS